MAEEGPGVADPGLRVPEVVGRQALAGIVVAAMAVNGDRVRGKGLPRYAIRARCGGTEVGPGSLCMGLRWGQRRRSGMAEGGPGSLCMGLRWVQRRRSGMAEVGPGVGDPGLRGLVPEAGIVVAAMAVNGDRVRGKGLPRYALRARCGVRRGVPGRFAWGCGGCSGEDREWRRGVPGSGTPGYGAWYRKLKMTSRLNTDSKPV